MIHFTKSTLPLFFLVFVFSTGFFAPAAGQGIKGTIRDAEGEVLPFASIYISNLKNGATSNINGQYEIKLPAGEHTLLVQHIGYETKKVQVNISNSWVERDFKLTQQAVVLREVEVNRKKEDPAYTIMRRAIAKAKYHLMQYDSYQMRVYMKGTGEIKDVPFFLRGKLEDEGVVLDEAYTTESVSEISFEQPDKLEEKVISIRTKGSNNGSPSPAIFMHQAFYKDIVVEVVSPLARSAFSYYKFRYMGSFREGDIEVNKIQVIPRSRGEQVFEGYIYIIEDLWAIHSLDLKTSYMGFQIKAQQNFAEVAPKVWMPVTHQYLVYGKALGFEGEYRYLASCSNYKVQLNEDLIAETEIIDEKIEEVPKDITFEKPEEKDEVAEILATEDKLTRKQFRKMMEKYEEESLKEQEEPEVVGIRKYSVDSMATKRDSAYWENIRPVPLSKKEVKGYQRDDSLAQVAQARLTGKDSTGIIKKGRFSLKDILMGAKYNFTPRLTFELNPTLANTYYNTVEGVNINLKGKLQYQYDSLRQHLEFAPTLRYGFSSEDFYAKARLAHTVKEPGKSRTLFVEGGRFVEQLNDKEPIHPHINTLSTLLFRKNYMKIYEKKYLTAGYTYKPSAAFKFEGSLEWSQRSELFNHTDYSFFFSDTRTLGSNRPQNIELADTGFPQNDALIARAEIRYRPWLKYRIYNDYKYPLLHLSPELLLKYRKGVPNLLSSDVDFDQIELGIKHQLSFGVRGKLEFELRGGTFLNSRKMYFTDYEHFDGNRTILSSLRPAGAFRLLDYYNYSTNGNYFSGHTHYQFRKFLLTQLPEVRFSGLRENIFLNYLKTENAPHYYEVGYSIDQILRIFRVEVAASFTNLEYQEVGLRIGIASFIRFNDRD